MASSAAMFMSSSSLSNSSARMILSVAERMTQQVSTKRLQGFCEVLHDIIETLSTMKSTLGWRIIGEDVNVLVDWWIRSITCGRLRLGRPVRWIIKSPVFGRPRTESVFEMLRGDELTQYCVHEHTHHYFVDNLR